LSLKRIAYLLIFLMIAFGLPLTPRFRPVNAIRAER
jgi:hypothetical protein